MDYAACNITGIQHTDICLSFMQICISRILDRGKTSGRTDDNMESLKKRFDTYVRETEPVINHYSSLNKVRTVNAEESEEEVLY